MPFPSRALELGPVDWAFANDVALHFLQADAAISAVADRLGISKSALLDPSASDPAVKVALAEAHTLAETKRYFESVSRQR